MKLPDEIHKKKILFCVLHWGLGHASRSISIIKQLIAQQNEVHLASDSASLLLLTEEFKTLLSIKLPAYNITYRSSSMVRNMIIQMPSIYGAYRAENHMVHALQSEHQFDYIISDNRYGCYHQNAYSIFIGHQLNILNQKGKIQKQATAINSFFISKFNACWIPDEEGHRFSGLLSQNETIVEKSCIGIQSRFNKIEAEQKYDAIAVLSGPEPSRTTFEQSILDLFDKSTGNFLLVRGIKSELNQNYSNIEVIPFLGGTDLNQKIAESKIYLGRAGYSTIMDLIRLKKKAILIPTAGQTEQEYLASHLKNNDQFHFIREDQIAAIEFD